jgi:hypothetical protein
MYEFFLTNEEVTMNVTLESPPRWSQAQSCDNFLEELPKGFIPFEEKIDWIGCQSALKPLTSLRTFS